MAAGGIEMSSFTPFGSLARHGWFSRLWRRQGAKRHGLLNGGAFALQLKAQYGYESAVV